MEQQPRPSPGVGCRGTALEESRGLRGDAEAQGQGRCSPRGLQAAGLHAPGLGEGRAPDPDLCGRGPSGLPPLRGWETPPPARATVLGARLGSTPWIQGRWVSPRAWISCLSRLLLTRTQTWDAGCASHPSAVQFKGEGCRDPCRGGRGAGEAGRRGISVAVKQHELHSLDSSGAGQKPGPPHKTAPD